MEYSYSPPFHISSFPVRHAYKWAHELDCRRTVLCNLHLGEHFQMPDNQVPYDKILTVCARELAQMNI